MDAPPAIIEVMGDYGGSLGEREAVLNWLERNGVYVRIKGTCVSACDWFLTLPKDQFCVFPEAWFGNHSNPGGPNDTITWRRGYDLIKNGLAIQCSSRA